MEPRDFAPAMDTVLTWYCLTSGFKILNTMIHHDPMEVCLIGAVSVEHFLCLIRLVHVSSESVCGVALAGAIERNVVWCTAHDPVIHTHNLDLLSMSTSQSVSGSDWQL